MNVEVRLFAVLREQAGRRSLLLDLDEGATVAEALERLGDGPPLAGLLARLPVRMAVNRDYASAETVLQAEDELALIPPISGGAGEVHARVCSEPLSLDALSRAVNRPSAGAVVSFQGITREVSRLDYESYVEMAERRIAEILEDCVECNGLAAAAAEHRIGSVPLGEPGVIVAVSAPHRAEAFAGAREAIDRIKAEAPIWKREVDAEGDSRWVSGQPAPSRGSLAPEHPR